MIDYIYKVGDPYSAGTTCCLQRNIDLFDTKKHSTTHLWATMKDVESIFADIKAHRNEFLPDMSCSIDYSEAANISVRI